MEDTIGKIVDVGFGKGGYQDAMLGFSFTLGGKAWSCSDFWGTWADRPPAAEWTEQDQKIILGTANLKIGKLLEDAQVRSLSQLRGKPVSATFDCPGGKLLSWRILTEVLSITATNRRVR